MQHANLGFLIVQKVLRCGSRTILRIMQCLGPAAAVVVVVVAEEEEAPAEAISKVVTTTTTEVMAGVVITIGRDVIEIGSQEATETVGIHTEMATETTGTVIKAMVDMDRAHQVWDQAAAVAIT